jgi:hypothetical protein
MAFQTDFEPTTNDMFPRLQTMMGDHVFVAFDVSITKTNLSTSWTNVIPFYNGRPFLIDFKGFTKYAIQVFWRKNGGTGRHDLRVINHNDDSQVLITSEAFPSGLLDEPAVNELIGQSIPDNFKTFRGRIRIQCKSSNGTDDPIFDSLWLYLIR